MKRNLMVLMVLCGVQAVAGEREVTIRIADEAGVPTKVLAPAKAQAGKIFARIGLRVRWETTASIAAPEPIDTSCGAPRPNLDTIDVAIQPSLVGEKGRQIASALPFTSSGSRITVYYDRVSGNHLNADRLPVALLAHVLAHEIGHVLLGTNGHARLGVMKASWTRADYGTMMYESLAFTKDEIERIHRNMAVQAAPRDCGNALVAAKGDAGIR